MKTLLINPDTPRIYGIGGMSFFPLGLACIAAILEKDHDVKAIDIGAEKLSNDSLVKRISNISPEIVGITCDSLSFQRAIEIAEIAKHIDREIVVVIGGALPNVWPTYPLKYSCFDIVVYGEGDRTAAELWDRIGRGEPCEDIKGIAFRKADKIIVTPRREFIENLDELPFPARHLFPMDKYKERELYISPVYSVNTSRGCPFSCAFCSNNVAFGRKYRFRSPRNVADEIELLIKQYGARGVYFRDDIFTANKKRVIDTCREIEERGLTFSWECESRVDTVDKEMLEAMKAAGCVLTWCGVESGSQETLNRLNKGITIPQIKEAYRLFKEVGIKAGASFMIGIPGETMDDIYKTIDLAKELALEFAGFNIFTGYPTSPLYEYVKGEKLYQKEIGHGILIIKTEEFDWKKLKKIQGRVNRKLNMKRLFKLAFSEIKYGTPTWQKVVKGIKILLGRW